MSKPNNSISKIKLPGESTGRPIIPYYVGYSESNNYVTTLPQLTEDNTHFVIDKQNQDINGHKNFTSSIGLYDWQEDQEIELWANDTSIWFYSNFADSTIGMEMYTDELNLIWTNYNGDGYTYTFPLQSGVVGLQIDIVDLTSIS